MSKYNVSTNKTSRTYNGIIFDSQLEMKYYRDVIMPKLETGEIVSFNRQVKFELQPSFIYDSKKIRSIDYKADYVLVMADGKESVIEIKGMATQEAKLKRKLFCFKYPDINYLWLGWSKKTGWCNWDELQKLKKNK